MACSGFRPRSQRRDRSRITRDSLLNIDDYWLFLLCGLPPWVFFAQSLQSSARSLLENGNLIRKVRFPRQLVPLSIVGTNLVSFAVMLGVVVLLSLWQVPEARATVWLAFPLGALFACIVAGFALTVTALNALYRDVEHLLLALLLPWFFLTPILYSLDQLPGEDDYPAAEFALHWLNSLTPPIEAMRSVLFFGDVPGAADSIYTLVAAVVALAMGATVFSRSDELCGPSDLPCAQGLGLCQRTHADGGRRTQGLRMRPRA